MWQRQNFRPVFLPALYRFSEIFLACFAEMVLQCVLAENDRQLDGLQLFQQARTPGRCAFRSWWQIAVFTCSRKTKTHRQQGDFLCVVECFLVYSHPRSQTVAARIVKWQACLMDFFPRRLSDDKNPRRPVQLYHRSWPERQEFVANPARADFLYKPGKLVHPYGNSSASRPIVGNNSFRGQEPVCQLAVIIQHPVRQQAHSKIQYYPAKIGIVREIVQLMRIIFEIKQQ